MKKIAIIIAAVLFVSAEIVFADSMGTSNEVYNNQAQGLNFQQDFSSGDYFGATEMIQPGNLHGTINTPPQIYLNEGWTVWCPPFNKTVSVDFIQSIRNRDPKIQRESRFSHYKFKDKPEKITFICMENLPGDNTHIDLRDIITLGYSQDNIDDPVMTEGLAYDVVGDGIDNANARYVLVLVAPKNVSNTDQQGAGLFGGYGMLLGSISRLSPLSIAGGYGKGSSSGKVEKAGVAKATFFNKMPPIVRNFDRITGTSENMAIRRAQAESKKESGKAEKPYEVPKLPAVRFLTGSSEVKDAINSDPQDSNFRPVSNQFQKVGELISYCEAEIKNNPNSLELLWIIGFADYRWVNSAKSRSGNVNLGLNRAENVRKMIAQRLMDQGVSAEEINRRLFFASVGKEHPLSANLSDNRIVVLVKGEIRSKIN